MCGRDLRGGIRWIPVQMRLKRDDVFSRYPLTEILTWRERMYHVEDLAHPNLLVDLIVCFLDTLRVHNFDDLGNLFV